MLLLSSGGLIRLSPLVRGEWIEIWDMGAKKFRREVSPRERGVD